MFIPKARPGINWKHEAASLKMFDYLVDDNSLRPVMEQHGLVLPEDLDFIKEQIAGPLDNSSGREEKVNNVLSKPKCMLTAGHYSWLFYYSIHGFCNASDLP
ncbi:hypothetical protein XENOCAPTIV_020168 [Xenoophorus captivus]|uniref:Uncharacterized protein n=1 Tax=Xenoophorus captivus TaxID=1517983 RepID=A0ABV0QU07_9TELE